MINVLIADDEPKIRNGLKQWIGQSSFEFNVVAEAKNGQEALDLMSQTSPELLFVDINMPTLNGLDFISQLKNISTNAIVVIITGYDDFEYTQKAIRLQVFDYLLKPVYKYDFENLLKRIAHEIRPSKYLYEDDKNVELSCTVRAVKEYIDTHYHDSRIDLSYIARLFNVDKSHISKMMKLEIGKSFIEYLTDIRLQNSINILKNEYLTITMYEVATRVGYTSQHYFSKAFKKAYDMSPLEYKKANMSKTDDVGCRNNF